MARMNVAMSPQLERAIKRRLRRGDFRSPEEYVHALIRRDQARDSQRRLEAKLLARLDRSGAVEMDEADFDAIGKRVKRTVARAKRKQP